jgi:vacuolar protein sorting-associated protein 13A/C
VTLSLHVQFFNQFILLINRVRVKLVSANLIFNEDGIRLATLSMGEGGVNVLLDGPTMRVDGRLGSFLLSDDLTKSEQHRPREERKILSIDGDQVADFVYETFDLQNSQTYPGYDTAFQLK